MTIKVDHRILGDIEAFPFEHVVLLGGHDHHGYIVRCHINPGRGCSL